MYQPNPYMGYQPYQWQQNYQPQYQQPVHGFVFVNGIEGARAYQLPPNSEMPLFDEVHDDVMYVKKTDAAGYPTLYAVKCKKDLEEGPAAVSQVDIDRVYKDLSQQIEQLREAISELVPKAAGTEPGVPAARKE